MSRIFTLLWLKSFYRLRFCLTSCNVIGFYLQNVLHRMIHDLWTLLQEMISYDFVIKKVNIDICPSLDGYMELWVLFILSYSLGSFFINIWLYSCLIL